MKMLVLLLSMIAIMDFSHAGVCSKDVTKQEVTRVCDLIVKKGVEAKKDKLVFENCGKNYVWIQDASTPTMNMVMHPIKRRLNGKPLDKHTDENGLKLFSEFDKKAKADKDGAWVSYLWAKPGKEKATQKISFVKLCKGDKVEWIVGSGIWKEDLK